MDYDLEEDYNELIETETFDFEQESPEYIVSYDNIEHINEFELSVNKFTEHHKYINIYRKIAYETKICSKELINYIDDIVYNYLSLKELKYKNPYGLVFGLHLYINKNSKNIQDMKQFIDEYNISEFDIVRYFFFIEKLYKKK